MAGDGKYRVYFTPKRPILARDFALPMCGKGWTGREPPVNNFRNRNGNQRIEPAPIMNCDPDFSEHPAFEVRKPAEQRVPFVFNSPHSGRFYPPRFLAMSRLDAVHLRHDDVGQEK